MPTTKGKSKLGPGEIVFLDNDPRSYGAYGEHQRAPWKIMGRGSMRAHTSYANAAHDLADARAAHDPAVVKLREKYEAAREAVRLRELAALIDARPTDRSDPQLGYVTIYEGHSVCGFCYRVTVEQGHDDVQTAIFHGCNR